MPQTAESLEHSFKHKMYYTQTTEDSWEVTLHWWVWMFRSVGNHSPCDTASHTRKLKPSATPCTSHCDVSHTEQQVYRRLSQQALCCIAQIFRQLKQTLPIPRIYNCDVFRVSAVNLRARNFLLRCCMLHTRRQFPHYHPVMCSTPTVGFLQ